MALAQLCVWLACGALLGWAIVMFSLLLLATTALVALPWLLDRMRTQAQAPGTAAAASPGDGFEATVFMAEWKPSPKERAVNAVYGLSRMLSRWASTGQQAQGELAQAQGEVDAVVAEAEAAALKISRSFRAILGNNDRQMKAARALLKSTQAAERGAGDVAAEALPDALRKVTELVSAQARDVAAGVAIAERVAAQHASAGVNSLAIEKSLDALMDAAKRVSVSVLGMGVYGNAPGGDQARAAGALTPQVRILLDSVRDAERDARRWLVAQRSAGDEMSVSLQLMAKTLRQAMGNSRYSAEQVHRSLLGKVGDVSETVRAIYQLNLDNEAQINGVVVAMQFFDINSQKLQKLKHPLLSEVVQRLNVLAIETRSLGRNFDIEEVDVPKVIREFSVVQPASRAARAAPEGGGRVPARPAAAAAQAGEVDIF